MPVSALLMVERGGGQIPICRTYSQDALRIVARCALEERRFAIRRERDELVVELLQQELERVEKGLKSLGFVEEDEGVEVEARV